MRHFRQLKKEKGTLPFFAQGHHRLADASAKKVTSPFFFFPFDVTFSRTVHLMKVLIIGLGGREHATRVERSRSRRGSPSPRGARDAGTALEPRVRNVDVAAEDVGGLLRHALRRADRPDESWVRGAGWCSVSATRSPPPACAASPEPRYGAARGLEGLHQGLPPAPRHPDRGLRHVHPRHLRPRLGARPARAARSEGRRTSPRARAWLICATAEEAVATPEAMFARPLRQGRRQGRDRGVPRGRGSQLSSRRRTARHVLPLATSQTTKRLCDGDQGPNTGRHGRLLRPRRSSRPQSTSAPCTR